MSTKHFDVIPGAAEKPKAAKAKAEPATLSELNKAAPKGAEGLI